MSLDITAGVDEALRERRAWQPAALTLELTESSAMADPQGSERALRELQATRA